MATVKDILSKKGTEVVSIEQETTVLEATRSMNQRRIGSVVVTDGQKVVGIFSERDVLARVVAAGREPADTLIRDVMSSPVACCQSTTDLEEVRAVMTQNRFRHLPVVEEDRLMGIISSGDIMAFECEAQEHTIRWMNEYLFGPFEPTVEETSPPLA